MDNIQSIRILTYQSILRANKQIDFLCCQVWERREYSLSGDYFHLCFLIMKTKGKLAKAVPIPSRFPEMRPSCPANGMHSSFSVIWSHATLI